MKKSMKKLKTTTAIIAELMKQHSYAPLKKLLFARDFLLLMNPAHQALISKVFIKKDILMILVKHPAAYQELKHDDTKKHIKYLIKIYARQNPLSEFDKIKELKIFTDRHFVPPIQKIEKKQKSSFLELSRGEFKNSFKDESLFNKFEEIRQAIKNEKS